MGYFDIPKTLYTLL